MRRTQIDEQRYDESVRRVRHAGGERLRHARLDSHRRQPLSGHREVGEVVVRVGLRQQGRERRGGLLLDLVYMDSPYLPSSKTSDFVGYTAEGFTYADQVRLRDVARELKKRGVHVLLSNSDVPLVRELYEAGGDFAVDVVLAPRSINSKPDGRGAVRELIVR